MTLLPLAKSRIRWRTPQEGGRSGPPQERYSATARFANEGVLFSVVLRLPQPAALIGDHWVHEGELGLLFPENLPDLAARLVPGAQLVITEGARAVADCVVLSPPDIFPTNHVGLRES